MYYHVIGLVVYQCVTHSHGRTGVNSMGSMVVCHHQYIYRIYLDNSDHLLYEYVEELEREFRLIVSF